MSHAAPISYCKYGVRVTFMSHASPISYYKLCSRALRLCHTSEGGGFRIGLLVRLRVRALLAVVEIERPFDFPSPSSPHRGQACEHSQPARRHGTHEYPIEARPRRG
eukprot:9484229-Pyramimonas_sp.AAC.2